MSDAQTLGDLLSTSGGSIRTGPFGTALKADEYSDVGVPIVSVGEVGYGGLRLRHDTPMAPAEVTSRLPEYVLDAGDIVFGRKGAVDRSAWVKESEAGWFLGSDGIRIRLPRDVDSRFVAYQFQTEVVRSWLLQHASGSTMLSLNQKVLERVPLRLPTLRDQQAIAEVLGALDDKIAANTQFIEQADRLQYLLYQNMAPNSEMVPLSSTAQFVNGKAFTKGASGTGRVVIRIAELNSGLGGSTVYSDATVSKQHVANPGDILFAWSGSLTLHRWFRPAGIVNQHIFKVIPNEGYPSWLIYELVRQKMDEFKSVAADKATTMGHIQRRHLDELVRVPSAEAMADQNELMEALWSQGLNAQVESLSLATTRDTLLPHLMSGKLRVKEAQTLVEEIV